MEDNKPGGTSDRDKKMMGSFEGFGEDSKEAKEKKEKKDKKDKAEAALSLAEALRGELKIEHAEAEEDKAAGLFEKEDSAEELPEDELIPEEAQEIYEQYAEARTEDLREDLVDAPQDSVEEAVILADAALMEKIEQNKPTNEEELDAAVAETAQELDLDLASLETEEDEPDEPDATVAAATSGSSAVPPIPPMPPVASPASPGGPGLPPLNPFGPGGPAGPNALPPAPLNHNVLAQPSATTANTWYPRRRHAGQVLLAGGVGYLLGRRRGRIKTEARLMPVQEKLESEVKTLHDQVAEREAKIRRLAAEKAQAQLAETVPEKTEAQPTEARPEAANELPSIELPPIEIPAVERPAEARPEARGQYGTPAPERSHRPEQRRDVDSMTMPELLAIAERIERNGISVKEMYSRNRLDALGLRRVISEYLHGDHLDRVLAQNLRPLESYEGMPMDGQKMQDPSAGGFTPPAPQPAAAPSRLHDAQSAMSGQLPEPQTQPAPPLPTTQAKQGMTATQATAIAGTLVFIIIALVVVWLG